MRISKIAKQRQRDRYNIFVDGRFKLAVSAEVLAAERLQVGDMLDPATEQRLQVADSDSKALVKAYDLLSRRGHSVQELSQKLRHKGFADRSIIRVIERLSHLGYLDDQAFARAWLSSRGGSRGEHKLRQELRHKGVAEEVITTSLTEWSAAADQLGEAVRLARSRRNRYANMNWSEASRKLASYLGGRGYSYDIVRAALDQLASEYGGRSEVTAP